MTATVTLKVVSGALVGQEFVIAERDSLFLGRAADCSLRLPDDSDHRTISRHHCLLDVNPPDIRIRDFGSRNGTYVNGVKIGQRALGQTPQEGAAVPWPEHDLADGDDIALGSTIMRVHVMSPTRCADCGRQITLVDASGDGGPQRTPRCDACHRGLNPRRPTRRFERCAACADAGTCASCRAERGTIVQDILRRAEDGDAALAPIQGYTLIRELGRGGMGAVYLARHNHSREEVALKVMLPKIAASIQVRERFLREARVTQSLRHHNIASVHEVVHADEAFFFTVEYCAGGSIDQLPARRGGKISIDEAVEYALQSLSGLQYAHEQGIVHRDLSPHNILLTDTSRTPVAKICDFGLAKAFDQAGLSGLTRTGATAGKPYFMSRQQVINFKYAKPDVDTWALAGCLYWMMTNRHPRDFPAHKDPWQVVLQDQPIPIRERDRTIPQDLAEVIDHALRDQPAIGFRSAIDFQQALSRAHR